MQMDDINHPKVDVLDVMGYKTSQMGYVQLNKENKYNVLTIDFMNQIKRCLMSQEVDEDIQFVVLTTKKNEIFCGGADLKCI